MTNWCFLEATTIYRKTIDMKNQINYVYNLNDFASEEELINAVMQILKLNKKQKFINSLKTDDMDIEVAYDTFTLHIFASECDEVSENEVSQD
jgi:hypothetical protein